MNRRNFLTGTAVFPVVPWGEFMPELLKPDLFNKDLIEMANLRHYEVLNNPNGPSVLCIMTAQGDGTVCSGALQFSRKRHSKWTLFQSHGDGDLTRVYHLLTLVGSPIIPLSVYVNAHQTERNCWLTATIPPGILNPGDPTWFVVNHIYEESGGPNIFAIDAR